jgi:hypothetical protein
MDQSMVQVQEPMSSMIRTKVNVDVELVLIDGTAVSGKVFIETTQRVLDLLNTPDAFFPMRLENQDIVLVSKAAIAFCKPLEEGK